MLSRRAFALGTVTALAGCTGLSGSLGGRSGSSGDGGSSTNGDTASSASDEANGPNAGPPLADRRRHLAFEPAFLRDQVLSGEPGKDGIPAIDEPTFAPADDAPSGLGPESVVFGVVRDGEAKADPQYVLVRHEIANDVVGGDP